MKHTDSWDTCRRMLADERCISTWRRVTARRAARPKRKSFNPKVSPPRFTDDQARQIWTEVAALNGKQQKIVAARWGINIAAVSKNLERVALRWCDGGFARGMETTRKDSGVSFQSKQKQRRTRRLRRRGHMAGLPTGRKRSKWPCVPMARRYHRFPVDAQTTLQMGI